MWLTTCSLKLGRLSALDHEIHLRWAFSKLVKSGRYVSLLFPHMTTTASLPAATDIAFHQQRRASDVRSSPDITPCFQPCSLHTVPCELCSLPLRRRISHRAAPLVTVTICCVRRPPPALSTTFCRRDNAQTPSLQCPEREMRMKHKSCHRLSSSGYMASPDPISNARGKQLLLIWYIRSIDEKASNLSNRSGITASLNIVSWQWRAAFNSATNCTMRAFNCDTPWTCLL